MPVSHSSKIIIFLRLAGIGKQNKKAQHLVELGETLCRSSRKVAIFVQILTNSWITWTLSKSGASVSSAPYLGQRHDFGTCDQIPGYKCHLAFSHVKSRYIITCLFMTKRLIAFLATYRQLLFDNIDFRNWCLFTVITRWCSGFGYLVCWFFAFDGPRIWPIR